MSNLIDRETFDRVHRKGLYGILSNYNYKKDLTILIISFSLSLCLTLLTFFKGDIFFTLNRILDMLFNTVPTIIGFLVAGFALMFGFGDKLFLLEASKIDKQTSLYLENVRAFSFALFILLITQGLMFVFYVLAGIASPFGETVKSIGQSLVIFILLFFGFYSLFLLYHAVKNVFNLTIAHHGFLLLSPFRDKNTRKPKDS